MPKLMALHSLWCMPPKLKRPRFAELDIKAQSDALKDECGLSSGSSHGKLRVVDRGDQLTADDQLPWLKICRDNLNLSYVKLFQKCVADEYFRRLEREVTYFTGDLLKVQIFGKWHSIPRKQVSYGEPGLSYRFSGNCVPAVPWTDLMLELKTAVENVVNEEFNFVLVNRYKDGEDYMGEHKDDEKDLVSEAPIASLSFGQPRDFCFRHMDARGSKAACKIEPVKLVLEHGSLLVMNFPTNKYWYHSLPKRKKLAGVRVNLTFRKMKK